MKITTSSAYLFSICSLFVSLILYSCQAITPDIETPKVSTCVTDEEFVRIPGGEFISGSDKAERDYAYRISAEAAANSPDEIEQREASLRKSKWFDWEGDRQTQRIKALNATHQSFLHWTKFSY